MDPDMVRQQEEEETASRLRGPLKVQMPNTRPARREEPIVLRSDQRHPDVSPEQTSQKVTNGWWTPFRAAFVATFMTALGLLAGIMLGVKMELIPEQRLAIGSAVGLLLGWQAAVISLRRRGAVKLSWAMFAPLLPNAIILVSLVAAMFVAATVTGVSPANISSELSTRYWLIVGGGALIGTLLAAFWLRRKLRS